MKDMSCGMTFLWEDISCWKICLMRRYVLLEDMPYRRTVLWEDMSYRGICLGICLTG